MQQGSADGASHVSFISTYNSDGLRLYARISLPSGRPPREGLPVVVFAPGWISRQDAPDFDFALGDKSYYGEWVQRLLEAGFAVVMPGYRGRGTVDNVPAEGIDFIAAWGNGSYLSPVFYSVDVLNLIAGLASLNYVDWQQWGFKSGSAPNFDFSRVSLTGHSQGGDVVLNTLAVLGDNPAIEQSLVAASIWSGNIPDRFTQLETFGPMGSTLAAFMSGDGEWTGSATGRNGQINPDFVFPWPADWIGTLDTHSPEWTWQAETWSAPTVSDALRLKLDEMYQTLNACVRNLDGAVYKLAKDNDGSTVVQHDPRVAELMPLIGGYHYEKYLVTPLSLHASDRDYYSIPAWNRALAKRISNAGGTARVYIYPGTNHSLQVSQHKWFSPPGTVDGVSQAITRDIALFNGLKPEN